MILFGSKARGDAVEFSDIDVLVLLNRKIDNSLEEEIFSTAFKIELKNDVVFGIVVYSKQFWNSELGKAMPLRWNIDKDGVPVDEL